MSTGYSWEGIRQVHESLLGARHVPERLCGFLLGALYQVLDLYLLPLITLLQCFDPVGWVIKPVKLLSPK